MKLSPAAEFGVRAAVLLAERFGKGPTTLETISSERDLPRDYLAKILGTLSRRGLVTAIRGKKGGYELAHPPEEITLLEVIEAVSGPIVLNFCQYHPPRCDREDCPVRPVWARLQENIRSTFSGMMLSEAIAPSDRPGLASKRH